MPAEKWKKLGHVAVLKHGYKCFAILPMRSGIFVPTPWTQEDLWLFKPTEDGRSDSVYLQCYLMKGYASIPCSLERTAWAIVSELTPPGGHHSAKVSQWTLQTLAHAISMCAKLLWSLRLNRYGGLVAKTWPTLCDSMDCCPPGSSVHGIFQGRILGWLPFPFPGDLPPT